MRRWDLGQCDVKNVKIKLQKGLIAWWNALFLSPYCVVAKRSGEGDGCGRAFLADTSFLFGHVLNQIL